MTTNDAFIIQKRILGLADELMRLKGEVTELKIRLSKYEPDILNKKKMQPDALSVKYIHINN